jgi:hypothetical protein
MRTIWKFPVGPITKLEVPIGAEVLTVKLQQGKPVLWMLLDPSRELEARTFVCIGTGNGIDETLAARLSYVDTFMLSGAEVYHLFEARGCSTAAGAN